MSKKLLLIILCVGILSSLFLTVSAGNIDLVYNDEFAYPGTVDNGAATGKMPAGWDTQYFRIGMKTYSTYSCISTLNGTTNKSDMAIYNKVWNTPLEYSADIDGDVWRTNIFYYAMIFGYQDKENFYHVDFSGGNDQDPFIAKLYKRVNNVDTQIASYKHTAMEGSKGRIKITFNQNKINVTFKSASTSVIYNVFTNVSDSTFSTGKIGVGFRILDNLDDGTRFLFDNLSVKSVSTLSGYSEDFTDPTKANESWGNFRTTVSGNSLMTVNNGIATANWAGETVFALKDFSLNQNYVYSVDLRTMGSAPSNSSRVIFNYNNENGSETYYYLELQGGSTGTAVLAKSSNGSKTQIATYSQPYVSNDAWVHIEVSYEITGNITVYATKNGVKTKLFDRVSDYSYFSGFVGIGAYASASTFDNAKIEYEDLVVVQKDIKRNGSDTSLVDQKGNQVDVVSSIINNNHDMAIDGAYLVVLTDETGKVKAVSQSDFYVDAGSSQLEPEQISARITVPADVTSKWKLYTFYWNNTNAITPIINKKTF